MNTVTTWIVAIIAVVFIGGIAAFFITQNSAEAPSTGTPTTTPATSTPTASATTKVKIAVLDTAGTSTGKPRGCDKVVLVERTVATTTAPLTAALKDLFSISTTTVGGYFNYIDRTNGTLKFDKAEVVSGVAKIYLTGSLSGLAGVCDDPRAQIQLEETALQFSTVKSVELYLNGTKTILTPSQQ